MRTIASETPADFRPPVQWIPPPHFPASSNIPLTYTPYRRGLLGTMVAMPLIVGLLVAIAGAVFASRAARSTSGGKGPSIFSPSGATPAMLAALNLNQNPIGIAKELGAKPSDTSVYVPLSDPRFEYMSISWDEKHLEHPTSFYLSGRKGAVPNGQLQAMLSKHLHGGVEKDSWYWFGGAGMHVYEDTSSLSGNVQLTTRGVGGDRENPRWKDKFAAVWKVALEAAFAIPASLSPQDRSELLGAGHPFGKLASIEASTTVEAAPDTMKRLFPGSNVSTFIGLDVNVAIEHPLFKQADMSWKNEKGGTLQSVHFRPNSLWPGRRDAFVECVGGKLGKPEVRETDYVNKKKDYDFRLGEVRLLVPESMAYVVGHAKGILGPEWVKIVGAVNECH